MARARALGGEDEPGEVGAGLGRDGHVLLPRQAAHLHERPRQQLAQLCRRDRVPASAPSRRGSRPRPRARPLLPAPASCTPLSAIATRSGGIRATSASCVSRSIVEGREIAGVDPDHGRPEDDRTLELVGVVRLDERVEAELARHAEQRPHLMRRRGRGAAAARRRRLPPSPSAGAPRSRRSPWRGAARRSPRARREDRPSRRRSARRRAPTRPPRRRARTRPRAGRDPRPGGCRRARASAA